MVAEDTGASDFIPGNLVKARHPSRALVTEELTDGDVSALRALPSAARQFRDAARHYLQKALFDDDLEKGLSALASGVLAKVERAQKDKLGYYQTKCASITALPQKLEALCSTLDDPETATRLEDYKSFSEDKKLQRKLHVLGDNVLRAINGMNAAIAFASGADVRDDTRMSEVRAVFTDLIRLAKKTKLADHAGLPTLKGELEEPDPVSDTPGNGDAISATAVTPNGAKRRRWLFA